MSHYYTRWCEKHGEWDDDVDNPSECPTCIELGESREQRTQKALAALRAAVRAADAAIEALDLPLPDVGENECGKYDDSNVTKAISASADYDAVRAACAEFMEE